MNWKFWGGLAVAALVLYFITQRPEWSANTVHNVLGGLKDGADRVALFITNVFS